MIRQAVGAVVRQRDEILLVKKVKRTHTKRGEWDFPKGGVDEKDTDLHQAIRRE